ncbi:LANO_0E10968g1_1 [Lachancea nothofagi CBS 11611]|uniref:LANO_0E10968g1_1 n=1 Tax=Lachancea nothofagi CBS 11611 TaxID=1266666 RepID=A0A1G4JX41_9SACH|nr:LANO_0E10968g1_1 [Lachancea nothofagi CBS 11611]
MTGRERSPSPKSKGKSPPVVHEGNIKAQNFNDQNRDMNLTSLPHKNPDVYQYDTGKPAAEHGGSGNVGMLYQDSKASVHHNGTDRHLDNHGHSQIIPPGFDGHLQVKDSYLTGRPLLYFTSVFVSLGVFLFGYDQGVMSGVITGPIFKDYFDDPSRAAIGNMVSILEIGALISSLMVGRLGEKWGRRRTIRYGSFIFIVGGLIQTSALRMSHLIVGRVISGLGVGLLSTIVPIYQSEISPPHNRGKLACIEFTGNIVGYCTSVWVDYGCSFIENNTSWRLPLFIQCVMGLGLMMGSFVIVETPRWLLNHDHDVEGLIVIADLHSDGDVQDSRAHEEFQTIKETVLVSRLEGEKKSYSYVFKRYRARMLIAMSSQMFAQLNGINVISYYAPMVFEQAGWVGRDAILMTGINSIIYVLSTVPPWHLVDKWGRKPILLMGGMVMGLSLVAISASLYINVSFTPNLVVIFVIIFNAFFGFSWGPIPWLYPVEIAPLSARSAMASASTATNWLCNWLVGIMTPILQEKIEWRLYLIHATSCFISFWCVLRVYPETAGLRLEDMGSVFDDKASTFSFHGSVTGVDVDASHSTASNLNPSVARKPLAAHPTHLDGTNSGANQLHPAYSQHDSMLNQPAGNSSAQSVISKKSIASTNMLSAEALDPPSLQQVLEFKRGQQERGNLKKIVRRGSETVNLIYDKVVGLGKPSSSSGEYGTLSTNDPSNSRT